jgi:threonylcarbamoyladenosine tRNA methylthiotransferase MtaB
MTVSLINLGCKVNQYELQAIKTSLTAKGHFVYEDLTFADAYVLNTCAVTNEAERKSRQFVAKALKKNPTAKIIVVGCASERNKNSFLNKGVSYVSGSFDKSSVADIIDGFGKEKTDMTDGFNNGKADTANGSNNEKADTANGFNNEKNDITNAFNDKKTDTIDGSDDGKADIINGSYGGKTAETRNSEKSPDKGYREPEFASTGKSRQFIKIQDGCDNFCSYCIIPYLRGRSRSRREDDIIGEIKNVRLKEVVLIGINLSAYGKDTGTSPAKIIGRVREVRPDLRIRLGSLEANIIDGELLSEAAAAENFCPHFHLSLQSGDDGVLKDMNRRYSARGFLKKIQSIREGFPDAAITTDIIVGFPTESAAAFENTLRFAEEAEFSDIHIFPYSAREGTAAANLKNAVSDGEVKARIKRLTELKYALKERYIKRFIGKTLKVLIEESGGGEASGYSENYIRVYAADNSLSPENQKDRIADLKSDLKSGNAKIGEVYGVKIDGIYKDGAKGRFV